MNDLNFDKKTLEFAVKMSRQFQLMDIKISEKEQNRSNGKYILYNSNDEVELLSNNKEDFIVSVRTVIIDHIVYCMDCNRDNLEGLNYWLDTLEDLKYNSNNTLEYYKPLFEDFGFKLIVK